MIIKVQCRKHPKYKATRQPWSCDGCYRIWDFLQFIDEKGFIDNGREQS